MRETVKRHSVHSMRHLVSRGRPFSQQTAAISNGWLVPGGSTPRSFSSVSGPSHAEYVIIGAGSAGCVVAHRLAEAGHQVTLIDAGSHDRRFPSWWKIHMPSALAFNIGSDSPVNWNFSTVPQKGLDNRVLDQPRGKVLGGSSALNAMAYVRGHALDMERWVEETNSMSWKYSRTLPYFRKCQTHILGADSAYRGDSGPLRVARRKTPQTKVLNEAFVQAGAVDCGYGLTTDQNGWSQEGFGEMDMTVDFETGERASAMNCYLRRRRFPEIRDRVNILTNMAVQRLVFAGEEDSGAPLASGGKAGPADPLSTTKVKGVKVLDLNTRESCMLFAEKEVILCAGAVGSVQILQSSGLGDSELLKSLDVPTRVNLPHVGENLEDHLEFYLQYRCREPLSLYPYAATYSFSPYAFRRPFSAMRTGLEWMLCGTGLAASNHFEVGGFIRSRSDPHVMHPDIQFHFIPGIVVGQSDFLPEHGYQAHVGTLRPTSRGSIRITKSLEQDPFAKPLIDPAFLTTERDIADHRQAFRLGIEVMESKSFQRYNAGRYNFDGIDVNSDSQVDAWVRKHTHSGYHLSCTCKMGKVVDPDTAQVFGTENLRIIDASVFPSMTSGNLNAPTIMVAEKFSDAVLGKEGLEDSSVEWWKPDTRKQRQAER